MKGQHGTSVSVHNGRHGDHNTWIVTASCDSATGMIADIQSVPEGRCIFEAVPPVVEVKARREHDIYYVCGEGGDLSKVIAELVAQLRAVEAAASAPQDA